MWVNDIQVDLLKTAPRQLEVVMSSLSMALHLSHRAQCQLPHLFLHVRVKFLPFAPFFGRFATFRGKGKCWIRLELMSYRQCSTLNKDNWTVRALSWIIDICSHFGICEQLMAPKQLRAKHFSANEKFLLINKYNFEDV